MAEKQGEIKQIDLAPIVRLSLPPSSPICRPCAEESGAAMPDGHMATVWEDTCCVCGDFKVVAAVSDWNWPKQTKSRMGPKLKTMEEK